MAAQLGPGDLTVAGHEDEEIIVLGPPHDEGLDDVGGPHAAGGGRLRETAHPAVPRETVRYAARRQSLRRPPFALGRLAIAAHPLSVGPCLCGVALGRGLWSPRPRGAGLGRGTW
ncbi:hypothetical protein BN12_1360002 [Nostocoides japonicum T1-X7]|uniref:Uncharacterized protein n=1 Tax=Nostocoides japonicum T1-X7 TaxID=1194083 RepID=A0A077LXA4_9MICO|nr:hypothetical protein BN12_1360002 [Tetrasphaera japonica T1-X7]